MVLNFSCEINEEICEIDGLHGIIDKAIFDTGLSVIKSTLESDDEESEHDYQEGE